MVRIDIRAMGNYLKSLSRKYGKTSINRGCLSTNKILKDFLPAILSDIETKYLKNPNFIINYWPKLVGKKISPMTKAVSFEDKTLHVIVKSSTLLSILTLHEKKRLLTLLQERFSKDMIKNIIFKLG